LSGQFADEFIILSLIRVAERTIPTAMANGDSRSAARQRSQPKRRARGMPLPDQVALVLQGGGALGSYQAGVIDGLTEAGIEIDWVAGISIGAVNAAIVAGNPPERRMERLLAFWDKVTSGLPSFPIYPNDKLREMLHEWSAGHGAGVGRAGVLYPKADSADIDGVGQPRRAELLRFGALARHAGRADRLGPGQQRANAVVGWRG
jgi:predicted acylesterase/phospholipase RssA